MEVKSHRLGDNEFSYFRKGSSLVITAQITATGKTLKAILPLDSISNITNDLFASADKMCEGFVEAIDSKGTSGSLSLDKDGHLTYKRKVLSGSSLKEASFEIKLRGKGDTLEDAIARIDELESRMEELEKLPDLFSRLEEKLISKINSLEKKVEELADNHKSYANASVEKVRKKTELFFNSSSVNKDHFVFSNESKTIRKFTDAKHPCLEVDRHLTPGMRIDFVIDEIKSDFAFGVVKSKARDSTNWNNSSLYIYCSTSLESIKLFAQITVKGGDIISLTAKEEKIDFLLNSKKIKTIEIDHVEDYYAYVSIGERGDKVSILDAMTSELNLIPRA